MKEAVAHYQWQIKTSPIQIIEQIRIFTMNPDLPTTSSIQLRWTRLTCSPSDAPRPACRCTLECCRFGMEVKITPSYHPNCDTSTKYVESRWAEFRANYKDVIPHPPNRYPWRTSHDNLHEEVILDSNSS